MSLWAFGDVRIDRVTESEGPIFEPDFLFPDATAVAVAGERGSLEPHFIDPRSGKLIMSFHSYVLRTARHTILVDTCVGNDKHRPKRSFWHQLKTPYLRDLAALGIAPEDVDFVLCTHLHVDHVGWNTRLLDGRWVPTFPNARYIFARREYEYWEAEQAKAAPESVNHGSFADSVLPVVEAGQAIMVEMDHQIENGLWLAPAPGHTPGSVVLNVVAGQEQAIFGGDVIHHALQFAHPEWSSRFCADPAQSRRTRAALMESVAESGATLLAAHFPTPVAVRLTHKSGGFRCLTAQP